MSTSRLIELTPNNQGQRCIHLSVYRDNNFEGTEYFIATLTTNETNVYLVPNLTRVDIIDDNG